MHIVTTGLAIAAVWISLGTAVVFLFNRIERQVARQTPAGATTFPPPMGHGSLDQAHPRTFGPTRARANP